MQQNTVIPKLDQLPSLTWQEKVAYITHEMLKMPQAECPLAHKFEPGIYIREMRITAGTLFVGRRHKLGHLSQLIEGSVIWATPEGRVSIEAPFFLHSAPGDHIVVHAVTDVFARTVHQNDDDCRDITQLEERLFGSVDELRKLGAEVEQRMTPALDAA